MKCVIAPDSYKESLSAAEVAAAIAEGFAKVFPEAEICQIPMADGGEGTLQALVDTTGGRIIHHTVRGPLGAPVQAAWGILGDGVTAIIEVAQTAGLHLVPKKQRNPLVTSSFGVGEQIRAALEQGCTRCLVCLGGSATVDGGAGMLEALGLALRDAKGAPLPPGGGSLIQVAKLDTRPLKEIHSSCEFIGLCDVENPLLGPCGAARVFAPQKGANPSTVQQLEESLKHWSGFAEPHWAHTARTGAAGGLGFALAAFLKAPLRSGFEVVAQTLNLEEALSGADLVITGEGEINFQTPDGKTPSGVAALANRKGLPVIAIGGSLGQSFESVFEAGIDAVFSISPGPGTLNDCMENARSYLLRVSFEIAKILKIGSKL